MQIDYPAACNAAETLLLHESLLQSLWPKIAKALLNKNVTLLCDPATMDPLSSFAVSHPDLIKKSKPSDYAKEHLSMAISVRSVRSVADAVIYINANSSHHTDCIVTQEEGSASAFCRAVDSAGTFVNASTRFADGFRYGFGTEVGISTGKIHARGPVGLDGLVIYKYVLRSTAAGGHIVSEFGTSRNQKQYLHSTPNSQTDPY